MTPVHRVHEFTLRIVLETVGGTVGSAAGSFGGFGACLAIACIFPGHAIGTVGGVVATAHALRSRGKWWATLPGWVAGSLVGAGTTAAAFALYDADNRALVRALAFGGLFGGPALFAAFFHEWSASWGSDSSNSMEATNVQLQLTPTRKGVAIGLGGSF